MTNNVRGRKMNNHIALHGLRQIATWFQGILGQATPRKDALQQYTLLFDVGPWHRQRDLDALHKNGISHASLCRDGGRMHRSTKRRMEMGEIAVTKFTHNGFHKLQH